MAEENAENTDSTEEKPKKKKTLLILIIVLVLGLAGGGGFFAYKTFMDKEQPAQEPEDLVSEPTESVGEMFELAPFVVNLSDPKGERYLKVKITLELESQEVLARAEKAKPKMRDMVIMMLTSLTFEEVMTPEGKIRIRDELFERFNHVIRPDRIKSIYFTEFVVQ